MGHEQTDTMPYDERDAETGQFVPTYPSEQFVDALRELDGESTTQEVRERVGCGYRTAHKRLSRLEEEGQVNSRQRGSAKVWLLSDDNSAFARRLSRKSIARQHGDDYFSENPGWADDLPDLGENA